MPTLYEALQTLPTYQAQLLYEKECELKDLGGNPYTMCQFQHDDWLFVDRHDKCCVIRSRGGSKTKDFVNWIIFRVLRTAETWMWMACKSGQLDQAMLYVDNNPFVNSVRTLSSGKYDVKLADGQKIRFGIISTSNLGKRVDGIIFDELEDLEPKQETHVFPQMAGMMSNSNVHKTLYLGTLWIDALLNEYTELYPTQKTPWYDIPFLVNAGAIQAIIDEGVVPTFEIDMLYNCVATSPHGILLPNLIIAETLDEPMRSEILDFLHNNRADRYGIDYGSTDHVAGTLLLGNDCFVIEEYEVALELNASALDFIKGQAIVSESGGYNDMDKYSAKNKLVCSRLGAIPQRPTQAYKSKIQMLARRFDNIYISRNLTPYLYSDLKKACFGDDGLWKKNKRDYQMHWLDAFMLSLKANRGRYLETGPNLNGINTEIIKTEKRRQNRLI